MPTPADEIRAVLERVTRERDDMLSDFNSAKGHYDRLYPERQFEAGPPHQRFGMLLGSLVTETAKAEREASALREELAQAKNEAEENKVEWYAAVKSMREEIDRACAAEGQLEESQREVEKWKGAGKLILEGASATDAALRAKLEAVEGALKLADIFYDRVSAALKPDHYNWAEVERAFNDYTQARRAALTPSPTPEPGPSEDQLRGAIREAIENPGAPIDDPHEYLKGIADEVAMEPTPEPKHTCGDPNSACDMDCMTLAYDADDYQRARREREAKVKPEPTPRKSCMHEGWCTCPPENPSRLHLKERVAAELAKPTPTKVGISAPERAAASTKESDAPDRE